MSGLKFSLNWLFGSLPSPSPPIFLSKVTPQAAAVDLCWVKRGWWEHCLKQSSKTMDSKATTMSCDLQSWGKHQVQLCIIVLYWSSDTLLSGSWPKFILIWTSCKLLEPSSPVLIVYPLWSVYVRKPRSFNVSDCLHHENMITCFHETINAVHSWPWWIEWLEGCGCWVGYGGGLQAESTLQRNPSVPFVKSWWAEIPQPGSCWLPPVGIHTDCWCTHIHACTHTHTMIKCWESTRNHVLSTNKPNSAPVIYVSFS